MSNPPENMTRRRLLMAAPLAGAAIVGVGFWKMLSGMQHGSFNPHDINAPVLNRPVPDFSVPDQAPGQGFSAQDLRALTQPVLVNFFASWCPPCKAELPYFEKAWEQYGDEVAFIFLDSLDGQRETKETIGTFIKEFPFRAPVYWDEGIFAYIFQTNSLPTTVFFDSDGRIVTGFLGMVSEKALDEAIALIIQ